jgi:hypothetical protein
MHKRSKRRRQQVTAIQEFQIGDQGAARRRPLRKACEPQRDGRGSRRSAAGLAQRRRGCGRAAARAVDGDPKLDFEVSLSGVSCIFRDF